jgi:hypothetical protein
MADLRVFATILGVDELAQQGDAVAAKTVGDTVNPLVTGLLASAAVVAGHPELAWFSVPAGAFAGAVSEQGMSFFTQILRDKRERVHRFTEEVTEASGTPANEFIFEHATDDAQREFLAHVVASAADARSAWKIQVLARAYVQGAKDGDLIDGTLMFINLLTKLEPAHVRLLVGIEKAPVIGGERSLGDVLEKDPGLRSVVHFVRRDLRGLDLISDPIGERLTDLSGLSLTDLGRACVEWLSNLGGIKS